MECLATAGKMIYSRFFFGGNATTGQRGARETASRQTRGVPLSLIASMSLTLVTVGEKVVQRFPEELVQDERSIGPASMVEVLSNRMGQLSQKGDGQKAGLVISTPFLPQGVGIAGMNYHFHSSKCIFSILQQEV